jgi:tRNA pseudouridine synthase 10
VTPRALLEPPRVEAAARAQRELGLCDACLGRRFAKVESGLTNSERGALLREASGGAPAVEPASCFVCRGLLGELDAFADVAAEALAPYEHRHFLVGTRVDPQVEAREKEANERLGTLESAERIQSELNREVGKRVASRTGKPAELQQPDLAVVIDTRFLDAELQHGGLFVFGRYLKHSREIPQTRWPCRRCEGGGCVRCGGSGKQYPTSVEEVVAAPFLDASGATQSSFHGAGREDIDARTIGSGRPFILELKDPRVRALDLARLGPQVAERSRGVVEVKGLRGAEKSEVAAIKEHRGEKEYRARVRFASPVEAPALSRAVEALRGRAVEQRTPQRVEHRRADLVRTRRVVGLVVEEHAGAEATLRIRGDAGLYIKELVSGDEGRTVPSLSGLLGVEARVTELDIIDVAYDGAKGAG